MATTPNMGLTSWTNLTDVFSHTQLATNWTAIDNHDHSPTKGVQIPDTGLASNAVSATKIQDNAVTSAKIATNAVTDTKLATDAVTTGKLAAGAVTSAKVADATIVADDAASSLLDVVGVSSTAVVRRGKTNIPATENRANSAYGLLTTPDRVQNVVLPTDGLIAVAYQATWQESADGVGRAAIFLKLSGGSDNQVKLASSTSATANVQEALLNLGFGVTDKPLSSFASGLYSAQGYGNSAIYGTDVTTGQLVANSTGAPPNGAGGPCYIFAAAGTYDVSIQFKASSGSVTVKNRKLWVWTLGF